jgi:hypothetical protein
MSKILLTKKDLKKIEAVLSFAVQDKLDEICLTKEELKEITAYRKLIKKIEDLLILAK